MVSVGDSRRFESAIDESNAELELVRLSESVLEVALGAGNASLTETRRGDEWAAGTMRLSPADTAELCERVIEHAEAWLRQDDRISSIVVLGGPEDHQEWALRREDKRRREQAQAGLIRDGNRLTAALVSHDLGPVPLLTLLNHTRPDDSIGGANASESEWPDIRIALQHASIRLRQQDVKQAAGDSTAQTGAPDSPPKDAPAAQPSKRKRGGRKPSTDHEADRHIVEAWASGRFKTYAELDRELSLSHGAAKRAVDRHRHRTPKKPRKS